MGILLGIVGGAVPAAVLLLEMWGDEARIPRVRRDLRPRT
jgi:hypothetical protein